MNMKNKLKLLLVVLLGGGVALAAADRVDRVVSQFPQYFIKGVYVHPESVAVDTKNKVTRVLADSYDFNFANVTTTCEDTPERLLRGARYGDPCFVGIPDAGNVATNGLYSCLVTSTDNIKMRHCAVGTADDPADSGFRVRVISSQ